MGCCCSRRGGRLYEELYRVKQWTGGNEYVDVRFFRKRKHASKWVERPGRYGAFVWERVEVPRDRIMDDTASSVRLSRGAGDFRVLEARETWAASRIGFGGGDPYNGGPPSPGPYG